MSTPHPYGPSPWERQHPTGHVAYVWMVCHRGLPKSYPSPPTLPLTQAEMADHEQFYVKTLNRLGGITPEDIKVLGLRWEYSRISGRICPTFGAISAHQGELTLCRLGGGRYRWAWVGGDCSLPERFQTGRWDGHGTERQRNDEIRIPKRFHQELKAWKEGGFV